MDSEFKAVKISENIYWVGAIDWGIRNFHGYATSGGTTYNAYIIIDKKITLIDSVKEGFLPEMLSRISSLIDPSKIDYIISNHAEPDHSGTLSELMDIVKPEKVLCSKMGLKVLTMHYPDLAGKLTAVDNGGTLSIGDRNLRFIETRMLHWPDSMFTYVQEDKLLFSQDAFGMHLASSERFSDELPWSVVEYQLKSYYANIITLYSLHVSKLLTSLSDQKIEIKIIAPDHGPVWRDEKHIGEILARYMKWASYTFKKKAVIIFDTMWHATEKMARVIENRLIEHGLLVKTMPLSSCERSQVADEMLDAAALVVGSPTLNNNIFPSVADSLTYIKGLKFNTPYVASFGSYGWSGEAVSDIEKYFEQMKSEIVGSVRVKYTPGTASFKQCQELADTIAEKVNNLN